MLSKISNNKLGQVGETVTWIVATVIIVIILFVSIFIASVYLGNGKEFKFVRQADPLATKSFFSYLLTKNNDGKTVYEQVKKEKNLNDFNGNLAVNIFKEFYNKEYQQAWVGISNYGEGLIGGTWNGEDNNYFGNKPKTIAVGFGGMAAEKDSLSNMVYIEKNSSIESFFVWGLKG